jgi:hypothetical protein
MKILKFIIPVLLVSLFIFGTSCKKIDQDPEYPFTILVKTIDDSTTVQNAYVEVGVPSQVNPELAFIGFTDINGKISFEYDQDAVFRVRVTRGSNPVSFIGCSFIRLEPNENVQQTVYLEEYDPLSPGCDLVFQ